MRKDIDIPEVKDVFMAAVHEWSDDFMQNVWYVYLVNIGQYPLTNIMVVSKAFGTLDGEMRKTSLLRHAFMEIAPGAAHKVEMIEESVLALNNEFMVTFFVGKTLFDRKYIFKANQILQSNQEEVPVLGKTGAVAH
jgi:hypothetical protein